MTDLMENFVSFEQVTYRDGVYHPWIKIFFNIDNVSSIQQRPELPTNGLLRSLLWFPEKNII